MSDTSLANTDFPGLDTKKFVFKKEPLSSSSSLGLGQEDNSFEDIFYINKKENIKPVGIGETCSMECDSVDSVKVKKIEESNKSLEITNDDYMDDEEFERRFGDFVDQFDENGLKTELSSNEISREVSSDTNSPDHDKLDELLNEISKHIDWDDNIFEEEPNQEGFKDRNDDSEEFRKDYEHSEVMPHQKEIINASLTQHDCFVLMPTGGGKSLCYQLPSVLMPGVTVVISPLIALICDQVNKLNALDISAAHMCSNVSKADCDTIYTKLNMREPAIKLLYLTPERIFQTKPVIDILQPLYERGKLARFVIDEAHCLSQWGHDFRPNYKKLTMLRHKYEGVPIMCVTATATKQVEQDVIDILGLKNVKRFIRSFNRPNIKYQVRPKHQKREVATEEIAKLIMLKFPKMSGIVYCLTRKDCEVVAEKLSVAGIEAKPYHAGMDDKVRDVTQREWMLDRFYVVVATIAFGLGIDKPDVRFVIHDFVPKSVEAFYQESGRAGRDGQVSYSYLFYSNRDVRALLRIMCKEEAKRATIQAHKENLDHMVAFAENLVDCRRYLLLIHLGEQFDRRICIGNEATTCDNCENIDKYRMVDFTKEAKQLCEIVKDLSGRENVMMTYVAKIFRGRGIKQRLRHRHDKHPYFGAGANMDQNEVRLVLRELLSKQILTNFSTCTGDFPIVYIKEGPKFYHFFSSNYQLHIRVSTDDARKKELASVQLQDVTTLQMKLKRRCLKKLYNECRLLAREQNLAPCSIMHLQALKYMRDALPQTKEEMLQIQHVTNANYTKYGEYFLKITQEFRKEHDALLGEPSTSANEMAEGSEEDDDHEGDLLPSTSTDGGSTGGTTKKRNWGPGGRRGFKRNRLHTRKKGKKSLPKGQSALITSWLAKSS